MKTMTIDLLLDVLQDEPETEQKLSSTFTEQQQQALKEISAWWESGAKTPFILSGRPGTGKTFLAKYIAENLKDCVPLFTAPTNEAVKQLEIALGGQISCRTTYSALGMKMTTHTETQHITQFNLPPDIDDFNLLIVDEASMVPEGKTLSKDGESWYCKMLLDYVLELGMPVLFLGQAEQLPPVDNSSKGESPVFKKSWPNVNLTDVVRHSGPILEFALRIEKQIHEPLRKLPEIPTGIESIFSEDFGKVLDAKFKDFDSGKARIIAWTNAEVDRYNLEVRKRIFGASIAIRNDIVPGDKILFTKPLFAVKDISDLTEETVGKLLTVKKYEPKMQASINSRAEIVKIEPSSIFGVKVRKLTLLLETGKEVITYKYDGQFTTGKFKLLGKLYTQAKNAKTSGERGKKWKLYHTFSSLFTEFKHGYAITGHRSQGSTIPDVYVDVNSMLRNPDRLVGFKNLYVAVTRARDNLFLIRHSLPRF